MIFHMMNIKTYLIYLVVYLFIYLFICKGKLFSCPIQLVLYFMIQVIYKVHLHTEMSQYLTIIPWARVGYEMVNSQRGP